MTIKDNLYEGFTNIPSRRGRGGTYSYVRWQDVADRMNSIFGPYWSSYVKFQDVVNGNVIVRVAVEVIDDKNMHHVQEGFGGAPLDDSSEAGNPFKAAYSKALKDACKKWGIGLYLDEESSGTGSTGGQDNTGGKEYGVPKGNVQMPQMSTPSTGMSAPNVGMSAPNTGMSVPNTAMSMSDTGMSVPNMNTPTNTAQPQDAQISTTQMPKPEPVAQNNSMSSSVAMGGMSMPDTSMSMPNTSMDNSATQMQKPSPVLQEEMPMSKVSNINVGVDQISIVQKAALDSILNIEGVEYQTLAREAFNKNGLQDKPVPASDKLTYQEAVFVVKHGNDTFRKR